MNTLFLKICMYLSTTCSYLIPLRAIWLFLKAYLKKKKICLWCPQALDAGKMQEKPPTPPPGFVQFTGYLIGKRHMQGLCEKRSIVKDENRINENK